MISIFSGDSGDFKGVMILLGVGARDVFGLLGGGNDVCNDAIPSKFPQPKPVDCGVAGPELGGGFDSGFMLPTLPEINPISLICREWPRLSIVIFSTVSTPNECRFCSIGDGEGCGSPQPNPVAGLLLLDLLYPPRPRRFVSWSSVAHLVTMPMTFSRTLLRTQVTWT